MIIRLTLAQREACIAYGGPVHREWIRRTSMPATKTLFDVAMPPIGWRTLLDRLSDVAYTPYGHRRRRAVPGSVHRAVKRIATVLAHLESHPAFHAAALPGEHSSLFLGWWIEDGERWGPYPDRGRGVAMLRPHWETVGGVRVTRWMPTIPIGDDPLYKPSQHRRFISDQPDPDDATSPAAPDR